MIYGIHRTKGAPVLGALPGQDGPFGRRPAPDEDDPTDTAFKEPATTDGKAHDPVEQPSPCYGGLMRDVAGSTS